MKRFLYALGANAEKRIGDGLLSPSPTASPMLPTCSVFATNGKRWRA
jgi:hypothetical protein